MSAGAYIGTQRFVGRQPLILGRRVTNAAPPLPVTSGLVARWIGDQYTPGNWPDASGHGNAATQATASKQPALIAAALNGHAVALFDGVDDFLAYPALAIRTLLLVHRQPTSIANAPILGDSDGYPFLASEPPTLFAAGYVSGSGWANGVSTNPDSMLRPTQHNVITVETTAPVTIRYITNDRNISSRVFNAEVAELLLYSTALSDSDRQSVETYLGTKYGITITH